MKKNYIWYLLLVTITVLFVLACSKDNDPKSQNPLIEVDNDDPIVSIFYPTNNAVFSVTDSVNVKAFVADTGEIAEVSLYVNDVKLNSITTLPWVFDWREIADTSDVQFDQGTYMLKVEAVDAAGHETMSDPIYVHLSHNNNPPTEPGTPSPVIGSQTVQIANPTLSWEATDPDAEDSLVFDLAYGNLADLSDYTLVSGLTDSYYSIPGDALDFETDFYWQITARDGKFDVKSPIWNFTTILPLDLPTNPTPDNEDEEIAISNIDFSWTCVNYAADSPMVYELYLGSENTNLELVASELTATSYTYTGTLDYNKEYFWRVKAFDQYFPDGMMSSLWSFTTRHIIDKPTSPTPINDSIGNAINDLQLGWTCNHQTGAALTYQVIVSTQTNFTLEDYQIVNIDGLTSNSFTIPSELTYAKRYYWKVYAKAGADSLEGPLWTFRTVNPISVVQPAHQEEDISIVDIDFEWDLMDIGAEVIYDFYLSTSDALDALTPKKYDLLSTSISYPDTTIAGEEPLAIGTTYYWRVRARHGATTDSDYFVINSPIWSFETKTNPIATPTSPQPANYSENILVVDPSFSWTCTHNDGADLTYDLYFGPDEFSLEIIGADLDQTGYTYNSILDFNREYSWKVVAKDGIFEKESELWRFDTIIPFGTPTPADGEVGISSDTVVLDWERLNYNEPGMTYDVYVTTDVEEFSYSSTQPIQTGLIATNYTYDDLLPETKYYWKVRANNSSQSTDSDIWSFTTRPENLMNWVSVNGGVYNVGNPDGNRFYHEETIGDFQLMNKEVTNLEYKIYLAEAYAAGLINVTAASITSDGVVYYNINGTNKISILIVGDKKYFLIEEGFEYHPVTHVSWYGAVAYADYYDYRLPTEWEWEVAARGGTVEDYPWGNSEPTDAMVANYRSSGDEFDNGTTPVGYFPAYHNLYDMAGNVWEWTSSDGDLVGNAQYKILRGGGWNSILPYLKCWVRNFDGTDKNYNPTYTGNTVGFRCAR